MPKEKEITPGDKLVEDTLEPGLWECLGRNIRVIVMERNRFRHRLQRAEDLLQLFRRHNTEVDQFLNEKYDH